VSCVWLCPTHIVLCYLSCLRQTRQITQHYMCWTQPCTKHSTTTNKTNNTTLYVLDTTIHKTQTTTNKTNNTTLCIVLYYLSCLLSSFVLCMVVSNTYSVVLFVLFVVVLCLVYGCNTRQITQHYMSWTQPYTRHRTTTSKTNNTTLYVLDTTIHKTQDDNKQDK
jgi:uncharacterized protein YacL